MKGALKDQCLSLLVATIDPRHRPDLADQALGETSPFLGPISIWRDSVRMTSLMRLVSVLDKNINTQELLQRIYELSQRPWIWH